MVKEKNGITLIALVITIIVLLILAGVSIAMLTGESGIITQTIKAKEETRYGTVKDESDIWKINQELDDNTGKLTIESKDALLDRLQEKGAITAEEKQTIKETGKVTIAKKEIIFWEQSTSGQLKIGDYVKYIPTTGKYTPSNKAGSSTGEITTETTLNWRYLGNNKNGEAMLISDVTTTQGIHLKGADGYNNGVTILDEACEALYNSSTARKVRNLKIEDIEERLQPETIEYINTFLWDCVVKYGKTKNYKDFKKFPYLYEKETGGMIDNVATTGELGLSDKGTPSQAGFKDATTSLTVKQTFWKKEMKVTDFQESNSDISYYNLLINNGTSYPTYWISSRAINTFTDDAAFQIRRIKEEFVTSSTLFSSYDNSYEKTYGFRPVIILNTEIKATEGAGTIESPYTIQ